jgi:hypothetical protein
MCPHFGDVTVFVRRVGALEVERMAASLLVVLPGPDMDVYSDGVRGSVFVGMLCGDDDAIRHLELYALGREPMLAFARVQVLGHARNHGKTR